MNSLTFRLGLGVAIGIGLLALPAVREALSASEPEAGLVLNSQARVEEGGRVTVTLTLQNRGTRPLYRLRPMFYFHHTRVPLETIHLLKPGESRRLVSRNHPPVVREGSYPVVARVRFHTGEKDPRTFTRIHTGSFFYKKPLVSRIDGRIEAVPDGDGSLLKILLKNSTASFKNVRLMLLLPPELKSSRFQGMMGFTLHGGEEKYFEVPVRQVSGAPGGTFPVFLLVEYGELMHHYSGKIAGRIDLGPPWESGPVWPQALVFVFLLMVLAMSLWRRPRRAILPLP